jgi:hypothetical protein
VTNDLAKRIALTAAVIALCAGGFFTCFERREVEVLQDESAEARRNHYLALGRLLLKMGHEVAMHDDLTQLANLPAPPATVILPLNRSAFSQRRSQALLDWVAQGGHLVVVTYTVWGVPDRSRAGDAAEPSEKAGQAPATDAIVAGRPDLLLDRFGLRQRQHSPNPQETLAPATGAEDDGAREKSGSEDAPAEKPPSLGALLSGEWMHGQTETALAYLEDDAEPLELEFAANFSWDDTQDAAVWTVAGERGVHLVEIEHGKGRIAALTSDEPLANATIGHADHAEFLLRWLRDGREGRVPVWIFFEEKWPSLFTLLRQHAAPALAAAAILLLLWSWRSFWRFGPALPAPDPARRRWLEHLEAAGRFHWRQDHGRVLLEALRDGLARELARKHPAWSRLQERERMERLAHASGLSFDQVAHGLIERASGPRSFSAAVRALERMRAAL